MKTISRSKFLTSFAIAGLCVPAIVLLAWKAMSLIGVQTFESTYLLNQIAMLFWPSSILLLASENQQMNAAISIVAISSAINILLYTLIGVWTWYGLFKHQWLLIPLAISIVAAWYQLLHI